MIRVDISIGQEHEMGIIETSSELQLFEMYYHCYSSTHWLSEFWRVHSVQWKAYGHYLNFTKQMIADSNNIR